LCWWPGLSVQVNLSIISTCMSWVEDKWNGRPVKDLNKFLLKLDCTVLFPMPSLSWILFIFDLNICYSCHLGLMNTLQFGDFFPSSVISKSSPRNHHVFAFYLPAKVLNKIDYFTYVFLEIQMRRVFFTLNSPPLKINMGEMRPSNSLRIDHQYAPLWLVNMDTFVNVSGK